MSLGIVNGTIVTAVDGYPADLRIEAGRIAAIGAGVADTAAHKLDAAGLLVVASPIRKVYSTREPDDVPPPSGPWVLLDNDPDSAAEKTQVLVGYDDFEGVTIVPDYLAQPRAGRTSLLTGLKKALRKLASRN